MRDGPAGKELAEAPTYDHIVSHICHQDLVAEQGVSYRHPRWHQCGVDNIWIDRTYLPKSRGASLPSHAILEKCYPSENT